jgi:nucleotide-binding universal stress UspA family protein
MGQRLEQTRVARVFAAANGSEAGQHAARFARQLALEIGAKLRLLSVETTGVPGYGQDGIPKAPNHPEEMDWSRGVPGIEIVRAAESWGADLVVIGRRGRANGDAELLGRTVDTVIRRRTGPCLLIPPDLNRLGRMMVALDGTSRGLGILPFAESFAEMLQLPASTVYTAPEEVAAHSGRAKLLAALLEHPRLGGPEHLEVRIGLPVQEILAACLTSGADLLVVGVRRGGPLGDAGSGHVGRDLLLKAPTAILTVPI